MGLRTALTALVAVVASLTPVTGTAAAEGDMVNVVNTARPLVKGSAIYDEMLRSGTGHWDPREVTLAYQWLRDGERVRGATDRTYLLGLDDLGRRISVRVTATDATTGSQGSTGRATSAETDRVRRAELVNVDRPAVEGLSRFGRTVTGDPGRWSTKPTRVRYQWLRSGTPIPKATKAHYTFAPADVGTRVRVRVTVNAPGYRTGRQVSPRAAPVRHRVGVSRSVTYHVETRGQITASVKEFRRLAEKTFEDPRGWRGKGVQFRPVRSGGDFTLVLAEASTVPSFSPVCSSMWSCRVGRYVIINQTRWQHASPAWNAANGSLRDYRHLVVNHETGHWLGRGHAGCPGTGQLAPVMMQQSKGLNGCRFNPWPTLAELR